MFREWIDKNWSDEFIMNAVMGASKDFLGRCYQNPKYPLHSVPGQAIQKAPKLLIYSSMTIVQIVREQQILHSLLTLKEADFTNKCSHL